MNLAELKNSCKAFFPAIAADSTLSRSARKALFMIFSLLIVISGLFAAPLLFKSFEWFSSFEKALSAIEISAGVFFVLLPIWAVILMFNSYINSFYFFGFDSVLGERMAGADRSVSFEAATFCMNAFDQDITASFISFNLGQLVLSRAGVKPAELSVFLSSRKTPISAQQFILSPDPDGKVRFGDIAKAVFKQDQEFVDFLFKSGIQEKGYSDAVMWVSRDIMAYKRTLRWWSKDRLGRIEGIGKDWAYGTAFKLKRYAHELTSETLPPLSSKPKYVRNDVERLEAALSKTREANVILVGEDGGSKKEVLYGFASCIADGSVFPMLEHKKVYVLDFNRLISDASEKTRFEHEFLSMINEAALSGNIIMVIEDLPAFMTSLSQLGVSPLTLLSKYLESPVIHFICMSNPTAFHQSIEPDGLLISKFETIILREGENTDLLQVLQDEASSYESKYGLIISQPVLSLIAESADRYIMQGVMPDKAIDLLNELSSKMAQTGKRRMEREDVLEFVKSKTGIPTGTVSNEEREKLIKLEEFLHKRVIGQDEAVNAIASAMRRSRAGVANPKRPIGSFLFMGPTGVGKTETTKALAQAFFNDENRILRLDMSEYTSGDALSKLIGSFQANTPGVLSSMLREKPYGVLLLDEFEKSSKEVMDLFLQVLDEGMFSDMHGKKVNARNLIIIATSNAGSDLIFDYISRGENLAEKKKEIIDSVIQQGIFRPEFLNRFDGVILFQPIDEAKLKLISRLMLDKFRSRIRARGLDLEVTDELVDFLMKFGSDPKFGARPMNRAIQDVVEQKIADKIIKGEVLPGQKIRLTQADFLINGAVQTPTV